MAKEALCRIRLESRKFGVEAVKRIAVGAQNLVLITHFQENVRMILRRRLPNTLELLRANANFGRSPVIPEFGIDMAIIGRAYHAKCFNCRHGLPRLGTLVGTVGL
jgi:hypothetical protein